MKCLANGRDHVDALTDEVRVPMLVGSAVYDHRPSGVNKYNSAILIEPSALVGERRRELLRRVLGSAQKGVAS